MENRLASRLARPYRIRIDQAERAKLASSDEIADAISDELERLARIPGGGGQATIRSFYRGGFHVFYCVDDASGELVVTRVMRPSR